MKNGLIIENGVPTYYENDVPVHKGIVKVGDDIYYIGTGGKAVSGEKFVHSAMTHHIVSHGTYTFGSDYKLIKGSYKPPVMKKRSLSSRLKKRFGGSSGRSSKSEKKIRPAVIIGIVAAILLMAGAIVFIEVSGTKPAVTEPDATRNVEPFSVSVPEITDEVWLVSETAKAYYTEGADTSVLFKSNPYKPFSFSYTILCIYKEQLDQIEATLFLSEDPSMENASSYSLDPLATSIDIDNLKVDTAYYYRVVATFGEEKETVSGSFKTAASHRLLSIPNLVNVRDVGGRKTTDGKTIKQNMIIRGSELDGLENSRFFLREDRIDYTRETFGFVSDMDLRDSSIAYSGYASRLGPDVAHAFFNAPMYASAVTDRYREVMKTIFSFLADESNYPIYMHCSLGVDRTGTIVYLLDGLLGLSEEEMIAEYRLMYASDQENLKAMKAALKQYEGDTIKEKIENFLIDSVGVTAEEIASIRSILLED